MALGILAGSWTTSDLATGVAHSHAGGATSRAAVVMLAHPISASDLVTSVTYGGVAMGRIATNSESTEPGRAYIYFLDGCPRGTQNVVVTHTASNMRIAVATLSTTAGYKVVQNGTGQISGTTTNPSWSMSTTDATVANIAFEVVHSGMQTMTNTPTSPWTLVVPGALGTGSAYDGGTDGRGFASGSFAAAGSITCGWTGNANEDYVGVGAAFAEFPAAMTTAIDTLEAFGAPWVGRTADITALPAPVGFGGYAVTTQTTTSTAFTSSATIPAGSTILIHAQSASDGVPYDVTDNSGEVLSYRVVRLIDNGQSVRIGLVVLMAFTVRAIPSGTIFTVLHKGSTSSTRVAHGMYVAAQARVDVSAAVSQGAAAAWSATAPTLPSSPGQLAIAVAAGGGNAATNTPGGSMTEVYDTNASHVTSGDRSLVTQYKTDIPFATSAVGSGTWSVSAAQTVVLVYTLRYWSYKTYETVLTQQAAPNHRWKLDETVGTTADDAIGASDGTYVNTPTLGDTRAFPSSTNDYSVTHVSANSEETTFPISLTGDFTITGWAKGTFTTILARDHSGSGGTLMDLVANSGGSRIAGSSLNPAGGVEIQLGDGKWHQVTLMRSGTTGYWFVDGQIVATATVSTGASSSPWHLAKNGNTTPYEDGSYDDWVTWSQALDPHQITELYDAALVNPFAAIQGIASAEAFGLPQLNLIYAFVAEGITSAEAFGSPTIAQVWPLAIASAEAFGSPSKIKQILAPLAIGTAEAFGEPDIDTGIQALDPIAITSAEAFGTPTINVRTAELSAIDSLEAFGLPLIENAPAPLAIASAEAFGLPQLNQLTYVAPLAISSAEAFGLPLVTQPATQTVLPLAIASLQAFGNPTVFGSQTRAPSAINSLEEFGKPKLKLLKTVTIDGQAIASAEAFGLPRLTPIILPIGIASQVAPGFPTIAYGPIYRDILGISSEESFTTELLIHMRIFIVGVASAESVNPLDGIGHVLDPSPQPGFFFSRRSRRGYLTEDDDGKVAS